jgi:DNA invertase Pin-like site-specific DNA recombinase
METQYVNNFGVKTEVPQTKIKYILYARKSTEQDEKQALSIDSQIREMTQIAERENLQITEIRKESHSAKESGTRPVFESILEDLDKGYFNGILTWAPDRLSRNAGDLGKLVDLIDQSKLITIKTFGQNFTNSPSDKFLLMILCSQAKLENDNKSINVKRGLRTKCEMGLWPARPPTGYRKIDSRDSKCEFEIDPERAPVIKQMFEKIVYEKISGRKLHEWLKYEINFKTLNGNHLSLGNVFKILNNTFYYGSFEFPKDSGNWYQGVHEPIIDKELFDKVRGHIKSQIINSSNKDFSFTKTIKCALCGSGITADEKLKQLKDGSVNRHVYYRCCKSKDRKCDNPAINETDLIKEFQRLSGTLKINELKLTQKIDDEIKRFKKMQSMFTNKEDTPNIKSVDIRGYVKFVLKDGSIIEKRAILDCFKNEIFMKNKSIFIKDINSSNSH